MEHRDVRARKDLKHGGPALNIYLDIDGVLLDGEAAADGAAEFVAYVTSRFPDSTYWLTGRCSGDAEATVRQLAPFFDAESLELLARVKPTSWSIHKSEAIDFAHPFLWFDDVLMPADEEVLERHGVLRSLVLVDLDGEPDALSRLRRTFPAPRR